MLLAKLIVNEVKIILCSFGELLNISVSFLSFLSFCIGLKMFLKFVNCLITSLIIWYKFGILKSR